jgi:phosphoribosylglycinamide formyltransferase-1
MNKIILGVLGSGKGSNFRAIAERVQLGELDAAIGLVISDEEKSGILDIAKARKLPALYVPPGKFKTKLEPEVEEKMATMFLEAGVNLIVMAGFMRVLKGPLIEAFPRRIINIHPSLLPKYPGLEAWKRALEAGEAVTGCTVHYVDETIDGGEVISQAEVDIFEDDTAETLHQRIQQAEHILYPLVIDWFVRGDAWTYEGDGEFIE